MKELRYQHDWHNKAPEDQEMKELYGKLVVKFDKSEAYDIDEARLFKSGSNYNVLFANGCSCWDGDWQGWELTKTELKKLAKRWAGGSYSSAEKTLGEWVGVNL